VSGLLTVHTSARELGAVNFTVAKRYSCVGEHARGYNVNNVSNSVLGWQGQGSEDSSPGTGRGVVNGRGLSNAVQALSNATLGE